MTRRRKQRPARSGASRERQAERRKTRGVFSIALSVFSVPMALAALLFPLPAGPAAIVAALTALVAGRGQRWPSIIAISALGLGVCGLAGGFLIGSAVVGAG